MHQKALLSGFMLAAFIATASAQLAPEIEARQNQALNLIRSEAPGMRVFKEGGNVSRIYGAPMNYGTSPEGSAMSFVTKFGDAFGGGDSQYEIEDVSTLMFDKFYLVNLRQLVNGIPVDKGGLSILVRNESSFPVVYANNRAASVDGPLGRALVSQSDALSTVKKAKPWLKATSKPTQVVFNGEAGPVLAWAISVDKKNLVDPEAYDVFVDARTGRILEWRTQVHYVDVNGTIQGMGTPGLKPDQSNNQPVLRPLNNLLVSISGGNSAYTNASGAYTIANGGSAGVTVNTDLRGRWVRVVTQAGANLTLSQLVTPPGPADFVFNQSPSSLNTAQVNGLIQTDRIHNFVKQYSPSYPGVDIQIPCNVNLASTCNAYYQSSTINFYQAGGGCPNTAYSTVVHHEYGHFIIAMAGTAQGAYGEGMGDVNASLFENTPWLGEDFQGVGAGPLRSCYNNVVYPSSAEIHTAGQIMSGAFWLTLDALKATVGEATGLAVIRPLFLESIRLRPASISPAITVDVLTLDDNDGNISNGTPHYSQIAQGFNAKNLTAPTINFLGFRDITTPGTFVQWTPNDAFIPVTIQVEDLAGSLDGSTVKLYARPNNGAWQAYEMQEIIDPQIFYAGFDQPQAPATFVDWYVEARDTNGHVVYFPSGGPASPRTTLFGTSAVTVLNDTFETDLGWSVVNTALTTGAWVRANPNGTNLNGLPANPEDDSNDPGAQCLFTGQGTVGGAVGDQDVDGGPTRAISPVFDLAGSTGIVEFQRWFFNDDGDDSMTFEISNNNGSTWVPVSGIMYTGANSTNRWVTQSFVVSKYVIPTSQMRVRVSTSDNPNNSITEAAIDAFKVIKATGF